MGEEFEKVSRNSRRKVMMTWIYRKSLFQTRGIANSFYFITREVSGCANAQPWGIIWMKSVLCYQHSAVISLIEQFQLSSITSLKGIRTWTTSKHAPSHTFSSSKNTKTGRSLIWSQILRKLEYFQIHLPSWYPSCVHETICGVLCKI